MEKLQLLQMVAYIPFMIITVSKLIVLQSFGMLLTGLDLPLDNSQNVTRSKFILIRGQRLLFIILPPQSVAQM